MKKNINYKFKLCQGSDMLSFSCIVLGILISAMLAFSYYLLILLVCFIVITISEFYTQKIEMIKNHKYYEDLIGIISIILIAATLIYTLINELVSLETITKKISKND